MTSFLFDLKGQLTVANGLFILLITAFIFSRYKKRKTAVSLIGISILSWLLCSTCWLPNYLAGQLEKKYPPLISPVDNTDTGKVLILVLGSGYNLDKALPPNAQLGLVTLGRLAEGIRIHRLIKNSVIVCSGNSPLGLETQAQVAKRAGIALGIAADELETLNNPSTTAEEAKELGSHYEKDAPLIIVTDAIHMPRAMKLFSAQGFNPSAAPTNYKVNKRTPKEHLYWLPSLDNINLMNYVIHEWLGNLNASIVS